MDNNLATARLKRGYGADVLNTVAARGMPHRLAGEKGLRLRPPE